MAALWGGEVYLGLYDIVFPVVRHNIDMPRFKNKKRGEVCGWISVLFIIMQRFYVEGVTGGSVKG